MESQTLTTRTPDSRGFRALGKVLAVLGPIVLTVGAGYGAVKYAEGATQQRLLTLEADSKIQRDYQQRAITREEFNKFSDWLRDDIHEIKKDVRAIRSNRRENDQ